MAKEVDDNGITAVYVAALLSHPLLEELAAMGGVNAQDGQARPRAPHTRRQPRECRVLAGDVLPVRASGRCSGGRQLERREKRLLGLASLRRSSVSTRRQLG